MCGLVIRQSMKIDLDPCPFYRFQSGSFSVALFSSLRSCADLYRRGTRTFKEHEMPRPRAPGASMPRAELAAAVWKKTWLRHTAVFIFHWQCLWHEGTTEICKHVFALSNMREVQVCLVFVARRNHTPVSANLFSTTEFWLLEGLFYPTRKMADIENARSKSTEQHKLLRKDCIEKAVSFPFLFHESW